MGPANPYLIRATHVTEDESGVRRSEIIYPDGIEIAYRIPLPMPCAELANLPVLSGGVLYHSATDTEEDGRLYCYWSFWVPAHTTAPADWPEWKRVHGVSGSGEDGPSAGRDH
ncbi:hypothetical protein GCM10010466_29730 [Planomonospora alba]|uniref:Uncharacterized protein n=1 Tax=Planomonospora alba TaxID=161354 RepID=A0ABP6NA34_9ACTN